ncbi:MAG: pilus assembly protein [Panacagrimonas sp.]
MKRLSSLTGRIAVWLGAAGTMMASGASYAVLLTFPDAPPFLSTQVTPNVMLLVDNSGSMDNIIWTTDYDPLTTYPDRSTNTCGPLNNQRCWFPRQGNVLIERNGNILDCALPPGPRANCNNLSAPATATSIGHGPEKGSCPANFRAGRLNGSGSTRCLRLPDPADPVDTGVTRYDGNYLNYLFDTQVPDGGSVDLRTTIPSQTRLQVAKSVSSALVTANPDLRFGLSSFNAPISGNNAPGGSINAACGSTQATVLSAINGLSADSNTPLAEAFYEITRYFGGLTRFQGSGSGNYVSPIQFRCQKNFVVAVTDGFPTYDQSFPTTDPADVADATRALPNWDGLAPATNSSQFPNFPAFSDGFGGVETGAEALSLYLDDLAKFAFDVDFRTSGNDNSGVSFQDPLFLQQNIRTYSIGFAIANQMLEDAASYGDGLYFTAFDSAGLTTALQGALSDIAAKSGSFASATLNSTSLNANARLFQASFNSANWTGNLRATPISTGLGGPCAGVALGQLCPDAWSAAGLLDALAPGSRIILSYNLGTRAGIPFRWASLPAAQQALLNRNANGFPATVTADTRGAQRLDYLRGDRSQEGATNFRVRGGKLGDIVASDPFFVGAPSAALPFAGYSAFRTARAGRTPMVYVGANDGMLHGFRVSDGQELLAYVPGSLYGTNANPKLARLTARPYKHLFAVDGSPSVADVQLGTCPGPDDSCTWASYLVGSLRYGGQGLFALNVTDPATFTEANAASIVKWEFTDANDADLGYTFSQPAIVKMKNGKWAAIVGNGYNSGEADAFTSTSRQAALFIVFMDGPGAGGVWTAGTHYIKIPVGPTGLDNGLATAAPVDLDGDNVADYIFAGDLRGNMWQFNVTDASSASWSVAYSGVPLYAAGATQPITAPPDVGLNLLTSDPDDLIVYFGTGRFIQAADNSQTSQTTQTFYGIFADPRATSGGVTSNNPTTPTLTRSNLQAQSVLQETTLNGNRVRITSQNEIDTASDKGWYIDLIGPSGSNLGERQVNRPILRDGRIVFTTLVPSGNQCDVRGSGWLLEVDARSGGRPARPALDVTNNLTVDQADVVSVIIDGQTVSVPVSGIASDTGMLSTPAVLALTPGQEVKYSVRSDGTTAIFGEAATSRTGRITWREILQ